MHLESRAAQQVHIVGERITFRAGETIHTENSYKFTAAMLASLFANAGFAPERTFRSPEDTFAVTLARAV
jgi:uncharacterized SAM-dependent methyltransferase